MGARHRLGLRFWAATGLASLTGVLAVVTIFWHEWLEALGFDPDHGNGTAEWLVVSGLFVCSLVCGGVARFEWRRAIPATS